MLIDINQYKEFFRYYAPYACVVRNKNIFYFLCQQSQSHPEGHEGLIQIVSWYDDEVEQQEKIHSTILEGVSRLHADIAYHPKEQLIL